jgi:hypothetical protein
MDMVFLLKCHLCVSLCFSCNIMLYFLKNYIYIYIYMAFPPTFPPAFPFFEALFCIVPVLETQKHFLVSCNLGPRCIVGSSSMWISTNPGTQMKVSL